MTRLLQFGAIRLSTAGLKITGPHMSALRLVVDKTSKGGDLPTARFAGADEEVNGRCCARVQFTGNSRNRFSRSWGLRVILVAPITQLGSLYGDFRSRCGERHK